MPVLYYRDPADEEWHAFATTESSEIGEVEISLTAPAIVANGPELWIDPTDDLIARDARHHDGWAILDDRFIKSEGGAMVGPLSLAGPPLAPQHAVSRAYLDERFATFDSVPIGFMGPFGGTVAPFGWHLCDGTEHGSAALEAVLGSPYAPDLRGRFLLVASDQFPPGFEGGSATARLSIDNMPQHSHGGTTGLSGSGAGTGAAAQGLGPAVGEAGSSGGHSHAIPIDGGGVPFPIMPPLYAVNHIIYKGA